MADKSRLARFKFWTDLLVKLVVLAVAAAFAHRFWERHHSPVEVAVLLPLSGSNSTVGAELKDAYRLAIEEINAAGGRRGRPVEARFVDTGGSANSAAAAVEQALQDKSVEAFFGCWTSECRRAVLPAIKASRHLLIYPGDHEGMEAPDNVFYTGSPPNQLVVPALEWATRTLGKRIYVVGLDDVYPRVAAKVIEKELDASSGRLVGTRFVPPGTEDMASVAQDIRRIRPEVVVSLVSGPTLPALVHAMRAAGITPDKVPTLHLWMGDNDIRIIGAREMAGDYLAGTYFAIIDSETNRRFRAAFRRRFGVGRQFGSPEESAYIGVKMWAQAVERAGSAAPRRVLKALRGLHYEAPSGPVHMDRINHHLWREIRVGRIEDSGRVSVAWESDGPVEPLTYPISGTQEEWDELLHKLNREWRGRWAAAASR